MNPIKNKEWENELWVRLRYLDLPKKYDKGLVDFISSLLKTQKQEYKGQLKRIWYQKGYQEGRETQKQEIIGIAEGMKERELKFTKKGTYDYEVNQERIIRNFVLSDLIEKLKEMEVGR